MSTDSNFMTSLLEIPYFSALAEENGKEWLDDLFKSMDVTDYDFSSSSFMDDMSVAAAAKTASDASVSEAGSRGLGEAARVSDVPMEDDIAMEDAGEAMPLARLAQSSIAFEGPDHGLQYLKSDAGALAANENSFFDNLGKTGTTDELELDFAGDAGLESGPYFKAFFAYAVEEIVKAAGSVAKTSFGSEENNVLLNGLAETLDLGGGNDKAYVAVGGVASEFATLTVDGGAGTDTLYLYRDAASFGSDKEVSTTTGFIVKLGESSNLGEFGGNVVLTNIENVYGSDSLDTITGDENDNMLDGRGGNDTLIGGEGNDTLIGGGGTNILIGGDGNDKLTGGILTDTLYGGVGNDVIAGGEGDDTLTGDADDDSLMGGAGKDSLSGGDGLDKINGGAGRDTLASGTGADIFIYQSVSDSADGATDRDVISDFSTSNDRFDFTALSLPKAADQFDFIATTAFSGKNGEIRFVQKDNTGTATDSTIIQIDTNGDKTADMEIELTGLFNIEAKHFDL